LFRRAPDTDVVPTEEERQLGVLAGALVSEGFASEKRAGFNNTDQTFFDEVVRAYDAVIGGPPYTRTPPISLPTPTSRVTLPSALRGSPLAELIGRRSAAKRIPDVIWQGSPALKRVFLQALFEGDGSSSLLPRSTISIAYSTRSRVLARDVQTLLLEFGVVSR